MDATNSGTPQSGAVPHITAFPVPSPRIIALRLRAVRLPGPAVQGLLALAIYLAVFILAAAMPLIRHLNVPNLRQYWTDPQFYTWSMRWWPYAVSHLTNPLYSTQIGAPQGYDLAWASTTPSVDLLMWPVTAAFGVLVSYNIVLLLVPPLSGWAAFVAARRLTGRFWAALLAGAVYGFSPYELVHNWQGQPNLTVIAAFPLMVYLVLVWWDGTLSGTWFVIWMTLAMALEFYTFNEAFAEMTAVWAGVLVIGFAVAGRANRRQVAKLALHTAIAYTSALLLAVPYLIYALRHYQGALTRQRPAFSLQFVRLILPTSQQMFGLTPTLITDSNRIGRTGIDDYVGIPLLLILLLVAFFTWSERVSRLLAIGFAFVLALAAGPVLVITAQSTYTLPWARLWSLPIARSAEPSRFIVFLILALAIALALWLAAPAKSRLILAARWALALLAVAAVITDTPTSYQAISPLPPPPYYTPPAGMRAVNPLPAFITEGLYRRYLRPGEIVVILTHRGNAGMLFQAASSFYFRIAGGYINASLTPTDAIPHALTLAAHPSQVADQMLADYFRSSGVGAVLVEQAWEDPWMHNLDSKLGMRGTSAGGVTVYPVSPWLASQARLAELSHQAHEAHLHRGSHRPRPPQPK